MNRRKVDYERMSSTSNPDPWSVADATFVEIEIRIPSERQLRLEFGCGLHLVIADACQIPLAAKLIETLRLGKEALQ